MPCYKTATMAWMYYTMVFRHHDLPDSIVSDRDPQFTPLFWNALCGILGVKVKLSTVYAPQTDRQIEIMNHFINSRLRPFVNYYQNN